MKTRKLTAIRSHKYGTRHLVVGDEYEAPERYAVALVAARRARFADKGPFQKKSVTKAAAPPEHIPVAAAITEAIGIDRLRRQAASLGITVDGRWGAARLQQEIEQARRR